MSKLPNVGTRFQLARDVDRYPHFIADQGSAGTVTDVTDGVVKLQLDIPLPGAEDWDNEVHWDTTAGADFWGDVEPVRERKSPVLDGVADPASRAEHGYAHQREGFEAGAQDRLADLPDIGR